MYSARMEWGIMAVKWMTEAMMMAASAAAARVEAQMMGEAHGGGVLVVVAAYAVARWEATLRAAARLVMAFRVVLQAGAAGRPGRSMAKAAARVTEEKAWVDKMAVAAWAVAVTEADEKEVAPLAAAVTETG